MKFEEFPKTWLVALLFIGLVILAALKIDSFVTAGISLLIGYVTGKHIEQIKEIEEI